MLIVVSATNPTNRWPAVFCVYYAKGNTRCAAVVNLRSIGDRTTNRGNRSAAGFQRAVIRLQPDRVGRLRGEVAGMAHRRGPHVSVKIFKYLIDIGQPIRACVASVIAPGRGALDIKRLRAAAGWPGAFVVGIVVEVSPGRHVAGYLPAIVVVGRLVSAVVNQPPVAQRKTRCYRGPPNDPVIECFSEADHVR